MEVCYWALLFMPLVIFHQLLNVSVQFANKRGFNKQKRTKKKKRDSSVGILAGYLLDGQCLMPRIGIRFVCFLFHSLLHNRYGTLSLVGQQPGTKLTTHLHLMQG
jgi:hypothetical protein